MDTGVPTGNMGRAREEGRSGSRTMKGSASGTTARPLLASEGRAERALDSGSLGSSATCARARGGRNLRLRLPEPVSTCNHSPTRVTPSREGKHPTRNLEAVRKVTHAGCKTHGQLTLQAEPRNTEVRDGQMSCPPAQAPMIFERLSILKWLFKTFGLEST